MIRHVTYISFFFPSSATTLAPYSHSNSNSISTSNAHNNTIVSISSITKNKNLLQTILFLPYNMYSTIPRYVAMCTPVHSDSFPRSLLCHFHPYSDRAPSSPMGGPSVHMKGVKYRVPTVPLTVSRYFPAVPHRVHGLVSIPPLKLEYMPMTIRWIIIGMYPLFRSSVLDTDDTGYLWRLSHRWSADKMQVAFQLTSAPHLLHYVPAEGSRRYACIQRILRAEPADKCTIPLSCMCSFEHINAQTLKYQKSNLRWSYVKNNTRFRTSSCQSAYLAYLFVPIGPLLASELHFLEHTPLIEKR